MNERTKSEPIKVGISLLLLFTLLTLKAQTSNELILYHSGISDPKVEFALNEIERALQDRQMEFQADEMKNARLILEIDTKKGTLKPEGFSISLEAERAILSGADAAGLMYGGLELAEQIKVYGWENIQKTLQNPYMERRGSKFNLPLDVRTPSYSDLSDAAQHNMSEVWSIEFWKEYIDQMARYRYNFISLWNLHPFPSMVVVPGYEDIALDNVEQSTGPFKEYYRNIGVGFDSPEILNNRKVIKEISIQDKIAFWQKVMAYGKTRNVGFYLMTWNIFNYGTDGQYGITDEASNEITRDYFRKCVVEMYRTYPHLLGIGLTTGENMPDLSLQEKEDWAFDTYGKATLEAASEMPDRHFTLIHRVFDGMPLHVSEVFSQLMETKNTRFLFSWKYAKAHVYSTTVQPYHETFIEEIKGKKTFWTLRNDDIYFFRWGAPDFVREFIQNIPYEVSAGYYYGSDQWIWGREFTSREAPEPRQLEIVKHWFQWMLWGRLGYNPELSNERFIALLQDRYAGVDAGKLFSAWQEASMVYPVTTAYHWGKMDYKWYIECCRSQPKQASNETGFHDVNTFIYNFPTHSNSGFQSIPDFAEMKVSGVASELKDPYEVAAMLNGHSDKAMKLLEDLASGENLELKQTLHDIRTISLMGKYYAWKIAGSCSLELYRQSADESYKKQAVDELTRALEYWKLFSSAALEQHLNPVWTNRVGNVDWAETTQWVEKDIDLARSAVPGSLDRELLHEN